MLILLLLVSQTQFSHQTLDLDNGDVIKQNTLNYYSKYAIETSSNEDNVNIITNQVIYRKIQPNMISLSFYRITIQKPKKLNRKNMNKKKTPNQVISVEASEIILTTGGRNKLLNCCVNGFKMVKKSTVGCVISIKNKIFAYSKLCFWLNTIK